MIKKYSHAISIIALMYVVAGATFILGALNPVLAAGKAVLLSSDSFATGATANELYFTYSSSAEFAADDTVVITAATGLTLSDCSSSTTDADDDTSGVTPDGAAVVSGQTYTYTFTGSTTQATSGVAFCIGVNTLTAGNYSLSFTDSKAADVSTNDYGAALVYLGDANDVVVTAQVQPSLAFVIRDADDLNDTNVCELGVLNLASVNECSYRLKVSTNANSGYQISYSTDGDLRRSGSGDVADSEDIDQVVDESGSISAGTEAYGIALVGGQTSEGTALDEQGSLGYDYQTDDTPILNNPAANDSLLVATTRNNPSASGDTTNTALVTHRATIDADTNTGNYQHIITYTVLASF